MREEGFEVLQEDNKHYKVCRGKLSRFAEVLQRTKHYKVVQTQSLVRTTNITRFSRQAFEDNRHSPL